MIISKLKGGLGNQLFQYAAGRALAIKHKTELKLDISFYETSYDRNYCLSVFNIDAAIATINEINTFKENTSNLFYRIERWLCRKLNIRKIAYEPYFQFWPGFNTLPRHTYLIGYWQTEKYFSSIAPLIRNELEIIIPPSIENEKMIQFILNTPHTVSVHIRRGDYANNQSYLEKFGLCSLDYYKNAVYFLREKLQADLCCFIFSDDPLWVSSNWNIDVKHHIVNHNDEKHNYEDLRLMTYCHHHIIANSSFSWWGAWLSKKTDGVTIAPKQWFAQPDINTEDIIPEGWIKM